MPTNQYRPFATDVGANTLSASAYAATQTAIIGPGYVAGLADAQHINTVLRQATVGVAGIATFAATYGALNVMDDGSPANFAAAFKSALDALMAAIVPAGMVAAFAASAPAGWLAADGSVVSRTTYAALFARIGTVFGAGDGSTTFKLPDLRGEFIRGIDLGRGVDVGRVFGSSQGGALESHTHRLFGTASTGNVSEAERLGSTGNPALVGDVDSVTKNYMLNNGSGTQLIESTGGTETRPRNIALLLCIKT